MAENIHTFGQSDGSVASASGRHAPAGSEPARLFTPQDAAVMLAVTESWLRRKATARAIPCTFLGKHLRFSTADIEAIIAQGAQRPRSRPRRN